MRERGREESERKEGGERGREESKRKEGRRRRKGEDRAKRRAEGVKYNRSSHGLWS